jgi:hypothetical protein
MTAVFINEKLLGFIPDETPIYGNGSNEHSKKQNDTNHTIIKEWLLHKFKHMLTDENKSLTYIPDMHSEYNGSLIVNNKTLLRVTTKCDINLYLKASDLIYKALDV